MAERRRFVRLRVRVEKGRLAEEEKGLRLNAWSSAFNEDSGKEGEVEIPVPFVTNGHGTGDGGSGTSDVSDEVLLGVALPPGGGTTRNPWPADGVVWIGASLYAPSESGPLVGARAGSGAVSLRDLRDRVVLGGEPIVLRMIMSQPGVTSGDHTYRKMNVRIIAVDVNEEWVRGWSCVEEASPFDFAPSQMAMHDDILSDYVRVQLYPFGEQAASQGIGFSPSVEAVAPIHAPLWYSNIPVPGWSFWTQTAVPVYDAAMTGFLETLALTALERHDMSMRDFVDTIDKQFRHMDDTYDDAFTMAVAVAVDACALAAVSMYYKYDEVYRVKKHWFKSPSVRKRQIESFHDALAQAGGDCEDLGALIHRVWRWIQLGNPTRANPANYWQTYGGWVDPVLDRMQHAFYWYVSFGSLGSVTSARFTPQPGGVQALLINSNEDDALPVGGHMWQEAVPVTKVEELLKRMNPGHVREGTLRPGYMKRFPVIGYPKWIRKLPHTVGEGTGAIFPLVLPLQMYMHTDDGRREARERHARMVRALKLIEDETRALPRLQIQRYSDRVDPIEDARANYFYRRTTKSSTDDFALNGIPRFDVTWTNTARRTPEKQQRRRQIGVPGEPTPGASPTFGVNMRDKILAANEGAWGDGKPSVALTIAPSVTQEEMAAFKARLRHVRPWRQPRRSGQHMAQVKASFDRILPNFRLDLDAVLDDADDIRPDALLTKVNCIFRRDEFQSAKLRGAVIGDVKQISGRVARATVDTEMFDDEVYNVRLSLWIVDAPEADAGATAVRT